MSRIVKARVIGTQYFKLGRATENMSYSIQFQRDGFWGTLKQKLGIWTQLRSNDSHGFQTLISGWDHTNILDTANQILGLKQLYGSQSKVIDELFLEKK